MTLLGGGHLTCNKKLLAGSAVDLLCAYDDTLHLCRMPGVVRDVVKCTYICEHLRPWMEFAGQNLQPLWMKPTCQRFGSSSEESSVARHYT